MITEFYLFKNKPKIGDYVMCDLNLYNIDMGCKTTRDVDNKINSFIQNNVGRIVGMENSNWKIRKRWIYNSDKIFLVEFENVPDEWKHGWFFDNTLSTDVKKIYRGNGNFNYPIHEEEIIHHSKNKKEFEIYINANKYNL